MSGVRVTPWADRDPAPDELVAGIKARRPNGEMIGIDRVLLRSVALAMGWNGLLGRVRAEFKLNLQYRELIMCRVDCYCPPGQHQHCRDHRWPQDGEQRLFSLTASD